MKRILVLSLLLCGATPALGAYDIDTRGVPKFVNTNYIELTKIQRISKFRSMTGHNYSDAQQFGSEAVRDSRNIAEQCRSMKHYFIAPDTTVKIFAPVAGTVTGIRVGNLGATIGIRSEAQPDFNFGMFHVRLAKPLAIGERVGEGQLLGTHASTETWSDIAVWVQTPRGKHLISYFETLTDAAFEPFKAKGLASPAEAIRTKADRDADPNVCSFNNPPATDFFDFTGEIAATQSISVSTVLAETMTVGDAPVGIAATASSGLPVELVSTTPKICTAENNTVTPRRPGTCKLEVTQSGNTMLREASPARLTVRILPQGASATARPRLSMVFPPSGGGPQSFVRFYNTGTTAGTVTASLIDGGTGQTVARWQSPQVLPGTSPQFAISTIEESMTPGLARPSFYSLKIEPETTMAGTMQHVVFDGAHSVLTNASICDVGTTTMPYRLMNVHSSLFDFAYPSTVVLTNLGITTAYMSLTLRNAADGESPGWFSSTRIPTTNDPNAVPNAQLIVNESLMEKVISPTLTAATTINISPPTAYHFNMTDEGALTSSGGAVLRYYYQHLVTNKIPGVVSDMSTVCALDGKSSATANAELRFGAVFSTLQTTAQSYVRFYNSGTTAGAVTLDLYGTKDDQPLGAWTSPSIPAGAMREFSIATIERELKLHQVDSYIPPALVKQNFYGIGVRTALDGALQHVLWRGASSDYSNLSTCAEAVTADPKTLMAVSAPAMNQGGYASAIVVSNTGTADNSVKLDFYDARDGALVGSAQTEVIKAGGLVYLDVGTLVATTGFAVDPALAHYIVKAAEPSFTGFLQHLVLNTNTGIITDMTTSCMM